MVTIKINNGNAPFKFENFFNNNEYKNWAKALTFERDKPMKVYIASTEKITLLLHYYLLLRVLFNDQNFLEKVYSFQNAFLDSFLFIYILSLV